jgi:hypothetical protein
VVDIEKSGHDLWVLRQSSAKVREYIVSVWKNGAFSDLAHFTSPDRDEPVVLLNVGARRAVLSRGTLRQVAPERWQRVQIEFEFESRNFGDHGHPLNGCDVIVCWRHNWDECPEHIEVLDLSSRIK